ncbi:unnamed protein product [Rotaria socialis]|nr:unnamed protein product [Rotaria socialis]
MPVIYLLRGISSLSKCDAIQQSVANRHSISLFIEMTDEYPIAYDIIWAFSFNKDIQQQLRSNAPFMSKLAQLSRQPENEQMRKTIDGILWNLDINHENRSMADKHNTKEFDIMISYSHKEKVLCKQIYEELIKAGYRVWIDFDQMHGNVMDAMAQAIEQSNTVIMCMSEQYRKSNYCRAEAQYAFQCERKIVPILLQKQYKPDGWLLFIIGQLLYVDFNKYEFARAMEMLFKELKATEIVNVNTANVQLKQDTLVIPLAVEMSSSNLVLSPILPEKISDWTQAQTQQWLIQHNLVQMSRLLIDCNGLGLLYLNDFIRNGDGKVITSLLQEDSLRKTGHCLSLIELSCFRSLMNEQKGCLQSDLNAQVTKINSSDKGIESAQTNNIDSKRSQPRQGLGITLVDPYYAFNPDYMGGNMPNVPLYQDNFAPNRPSSCRCSCGYMSFAPPITCMGAQSCVSYCLQMYPGHCTLINTYGCCGSSCRYFQSESLDNRYCLCNCAGQQYLNPVDQCTSSQACLTKCLAHFPQICIPIATQACCGQDCKSYSQTVANLCACRCQGNTYYPSPKCMNPEECVSTCMTTYGDCTYSETEGCCGAACTAYIPTCSCSCGPEFRTMTSVPCRSSRSCVETCMSSYGACKQDNTQACCGNDCINGFPSCTCMCGANTIMTLPMSCGSAEQCVRTCLQSVPQCNVANVRGCCGTDCAPFFPTCQCQCGSGVYYASITCASAEQCTNACISQYGYLCSPTNTIGCCNGTFCTKRNRFLGVSHAHTFQVSYSAILFSLNFFIFFI